MGIKLDQNNIREEDKQLAISVRNHLISGNKVIGSPGKGLEQTLAKLEEKRDSREVSKTDWLVKDANLERQIMLTKAGIEGEQKLCEYLSTLLKYDDRLSGVVAFASLSYELENNTKDYIPDTDTLLVYGKNILILDAKNIKTKSNVALQVADGEIIDSKGNVILEVHPSTHIWKKIMNKIGFELDSIEGYVCIVNNTETEIIRDDEWYNCDTKLIHIAELQEELVKWVENKDSKLYLNMLTEIAKSQIKEEQSLSLDIDSIKRQFGV